MSKPILVTVLLAALASCQSSAPVPTPGPVPADAIPASVRAEILERNRALEEHFRRGDLRAIASAYTDDAVLVDAGSTVGVGRERVDEYWTSIPEPRDWKLEVLDLEGDDRFVLQRGRSTLVYAPNGVERRSTVEFVVAWRKGADGIWRIASDTWWSPRR